MRIAVDEDELHIRVLILRLINRLLKQKARRNDHLRAVFYGLIDGFQICGVALLGGLIVLMRNVLFLGILHKAFPCALVEGFVVDGTDVGDERQLRTLVLLAAARKEAQCQHGRHCKCKQFLHIQSPFFCPPQGRTQRMPGAAVLRRHRPARSIPSKDGAGTAF